MHPTVGAVIRVASKPAQARDFDAALTHGRTMVAMHRRLLRTAAAAVALAAPLAAPLAAAPSPARATQDPCAVAVSEIGTGRADCASIGLLQIGWKWLTVLTVQPAGQQPAQVGPALAAGLSAIGAAGVDPASPQWAESVLAPLTAAVAGGAPAFVAATVQPACPPLEVVFTGAGVGFGAGLALLAKPDPAGALERFRAVRAALVAAPGASTTCPSAPSR